MATTVSPVAAPVTVTVRFEQTLLAVVGKSSDAVADKCLDIAVPLVPRVVVPVTANAPLFVVVIPVLPKETDVALVVPRFNAAAESTVKAPVVVFQVEAAPAVNVKAPLEVKLDAPVGVKLTDPAPDAVKLPDVNV